MADGIKHRSYDGYEKSDGSSPTVMADSMYLMGTIAAFEERAQGIMDAANAFLHADNDEDVLMILRVKLAELLVKVDPSMYREYVTTSKKGVSMLYVKLDKALYGMLRASLLFYNKIRRDLDEMGFVINPYDPSR